MAAASPLHTLKADASCPICLDFYRDPVIAECGHNFCRACILACPPGPAQALHCPQCRVASARGRLRPNRQLQSMVESVKQLSLQAERSGEGGLCPEHEEKLKLFCQEDKKLICVICRESRDHRSHTALPIKEAAMEYKDELQSWLRLLMKEKEGFMASKQKVEEEFKAIKNKLVVARQRTVAEFQRLYQLLKAQEQAMLKRLAEMDRKVTMSENAKVAKLSGQISPLDALIKEIQAKCRQSAEGFLQDFRSTLSRCENAKFREPEKIIHEPREPWWNYKVPVTLDPDTANKDLLLSESGRRVRWTDRLQTVPDNPKRFTSDRSVLGTEGFKSGKHYWEVQVVEDGGGWFVGAARESVSRDPGLPGGGIWALWWYNDVHMAVTAYLSCYTGTSSDYPLFLHDHPKKLGVYLDYEAGRLSLYNTDTMEHLHTFIKAAFNERIFPFFCLWGAEVRVV
ncbi:E3 ubiquitin-protein ligase TRIM7-like [Lissotriton helveticus]